jgi:DNA-binding response OmpR family regulator
MVQSIRGYRVDAREAPEIIRPHISNLRRKLSAALAEADVVQTVRGVGYILRDQRS